MLLWYGAKTAHIASILQKGISMPDSEYPKELLPFGKGIYFYDIVSKAANYCMADKISPIGILLLCEVALGGVEEKVKVDYDAENLADGKHSVKGIGKVASSCEEYEASAYDSEV
mmetsp:Transcript_34031/g.30820  ORF Transcript_34031/g.30820 Transcript_34031/m.30820 type:complete len:115 (+) Transcript_34031:1324-1668(+)|eukprot:CAMPEP_0114581816 /NCGR_PEP_ID=MMETSP0125-20121206/5886_1 /TAXON_ID=485358 ORGANISM="Aristerostoma sp., Strain ATCC 50986" /NCGR_SAMPLE_ID=MMETSP0125 /ASSEMBLY_ACC=CAM_ASM_000245 /LENGTH=114 /DNA_ID=CAMNT_0001774325 /DNA_START=1257 /DNA_END=1601 /DNA_ORIENTATION=-